MRGSDWSVSPKPFYQSLLTFKLLIFSDTPTAKSILSPSSSTTKSSTHSSSSSATSATSYVYGTSKYA